jgi:hypothetical protein
MRDTHARNRVRLWTFTLVKHAVVAACGRSGAGSWADWAAYRESPAVAAKDNGSADEVPDR